MTAQLPSRSFPADPAEIARIEAILRSEPGLEQVDPQTLHAALTRIAPGTTLSLTDQEQQSGPLQSAREQAFSG